MTNRTEVRDVLVRLVLPLAARSSPGGARVKLGANGAAFPDVCAEVEGFARPLWGLVPLAAGGGEWDGWDRIRQGLVHGTDPSHPEFWGTTSDFDQRLAELPPIALGLCLLPRELWEPLPTRARKTLTAYLRAINERQLPDNNWLFFRVLVNLALDRVGAGGDRARMTSDLDRLESFYLGDGWSSDGLNLQRDYYVAFALHYYALIYSVLARTADPQRCERFRERAGLFAQDFVHWFTASGAGLPFGRSLTYRFAQGAFWGALAFADVEALPWGVVKGLALRNLRWWQRRPIFTDSGLLTVGYTYPNLNMAEEYNSPGSPYWAFKAFLPLALPNSHPFWAAEERPLPDLPARVRQPHARFLVCRDARTDHVVALNGGQWAGWRPRHVAAKYAKFCYSTHFAFSVPGGSFGLTQAGHDNVLALSEEGDYFRVRGESSEVEVADSHVAFTWKPWPDVEVRTWLIPVGISHVRVHRLRSKKPLIVAEGGFAVDCSGDDRSPFVQAHREGEGLARANYPSGWCEIRDLSGGRRGQVVRPAPNTNLQAPRTVVPTLGSRHQAGESWLACVVLGQPGAKPETSKPDHGLTWKRTPTGFVLTTAAGLVLTC